MKKKILYVEQPNGAFLDILGFEEYEDFELLRSKLINDLHCHFGEMKVGPYSGIFPFVYQNQEYALIFDEEDGCCIRIDLDKQEYLKTFMHKLELILPDR